LINYEELQAIKLYNQKKTKKIIKSGYVHCNTGGKKEVIGIQANYEAALTIANLNDYVNSKEPISENNLLDIKVKI
jgi:hypothetical protein